MDGLRAIGASHDLDLHVQGLPAAFHVSFGPDSPVHDFRGAKRLDLARYARLAQTMSDHGLWCTGRGIWYVSTTHGPDELADTLTRFEDAVIAGAA